MKLKLILFVGLFAIGFAMAATAGNSPDADADGVPDAFDNCGVPNGPLLGGCSEQENFDGDDFGDSCDGDYNNDGFVNSIDFGPFFTAFLANAPIVGDEDSNCDGLVNSIDFGPFFTQFLKNSPGLP